MRVRMQMQMWLLGQLDAYSALWRLTTEYDRRQKVL